MSEMGDGVKATINFLNQAIIDIQRLCAVELNKDEQMELRIRLCHVIDDVVEKAEKRIENE